ncbi:aminopeptidase P N-terminal domain-containing protein [Actimicrobium sp. CCC2.4]|uniref:aminopeptidase P N-terminal domain-containing protein n=1 Tax=Actimicrobium sp. CCC2.4 TaxID=3048606 RepID=UPI002AC9BC1C|nr:aminopeptidase P N-terminal domain-containing protein [Actimicrobium sp. CCC2.4]MEB0135786.1 aminopeptidase P N-terminal domain-containing protein [Actimicrobium sp. CCC2.4]WPX33267.1 aminopeptidase P N-terminal domain-containing protein [Actimicrobium sp. CCC2.4]
MSPYAARRASLIAQMQARGGGVAIIPTAPEQHRNSDAEYPYRHDSTFYYLSGFAEPEAVIVLVAGKKTQSILFCREKNTEREIWEGFRHGPEGAREAFGFDAAFPIDALDAILPKLLADEPALFYALGSNAALDAQVRGWLKKVRTQSRAGITAPSSAHDVSCLLNEMRLIKDDSELAIMRRAATVSAEAHARAMRMARPGLHEYQIDAELLHEFRNHGSDFPAYTSIVATGANACVLHYRAGATILQDGDLVLIDAGCELDGYASDITRTFPANGTFTPAQATLYALVLAAQHAAIAAIGPGKRFMDGHDAAVRILSQGMLDTGLLDADKVGTLDDVITNGDYRQFYMHRTGHWLGMDVHDVGEYREVNDTTTAGGDKPWRILHPGMTLTVEPGIYVRPAPGIPEQYWNIGIRIEDDIAVTAGGAEVMSSDAPKTIADIEAMMRNA